MGESADNDEPEADQREQGEGMSPETLVRRVALLLVPLLLVSAYFLRASDSGEADPLAAATATAAAGPAPPASSARQRAIAVQPPALSPMASAVAKYGEQGLATAPSAADSAERPPPSALAVAGERVGTPAVDLPVVGPANPAPRAPAAPAAPCGGLFVRLITFAEDEKFAFASLAQGFSEPAKVLHIGESIAGYRVTGIEWDRVWVQSAKERCAVGMHVGARDAQEQKQLTAAEYASLPWVLPHSIVSGLDKRAEMEFVLDEKTIADLYERGADVFAGLRIKGYQSDSGEMRGLVLFDVRLDSFLERLGIEQGDVLVSIDATPVVSVNDVLKALELARDAETLTAGFLRDGEPFQLNLKARGIP